MKSKLNLLNSRFHNQMITNLICNYNIDILILIHILCIFYHQKRNFLYTHIHCCPFLVLHRFHTCLYNYSNRLLHLFVCAIFRSYIHKCYFLQLLQYLHFPHKIMSNLLLYILPYIYMYIILSILGIPFYSRYPIYIKLNNLIQ